MRFLLRSIAAVLCVLAIAAAIFVCFPLWVNDQVIRWNLHRAGVASEYIQAGPYKLHYLEASPTNGTAGVPLLLIHGLGARAEDWAPMIPPLAAAGFHVYAPDLPGFGLSPRPDVPYTIAFQTQAMIDFLHAVHVTRADVGGWSMGGWIAAKLTLDHPEMVDRLALYDSAGVYFPRTFDADLFLPTDAAELNHLSAMLMPNPPAMPSFVAHAAVRKLLANDRVIRSSVAAMLSGHDLLDFRIGAIQKPTLIVWGREDRLIPLWTGEKMHRQIAGSVLFVVDGCGHLAPSQCVPPIVQETIAFFTASPVLPPGESSAPHPATQ